GDGGQPGQGGGDLDQQVGPVDDLPQFDGLQDGLVGVVCQPWVDLDRHPAVDSAGQFILLGQHVAGVAHVVGGDGADGGVHVGAAFGQLFDLFVIGGALRQRALEDRRVGGNTDDTHGVDQLLEVAGLETL